MSGAELNAQANHLRDRVHTVTADIDRKADSLLVGPGVVLAPYVAQVKGVDAAVRWFVDFHIDGLGDSESLRRVQRDLEDMSAALTARADDVAAISLPTAVTWLEGDETYRTSATRQRRSLSAVASGASGAASALATTAERIDAHTQAVVDAARGMLDVFEDFAMLLLSMAETLASGPASPAVAARAALDLAKFVLSISDYLGSENDVDVAGWAIEDSVAGYSEELSWLEGEFAGMSWPAATAS